MQTASAVAGDVGFLSPKMFNRDSAVDMPFSSGSADFFVPSYRRKPVSSFPRSLDSGFRRSDDPTAESRFNEKLRLGLSAALKITDHWLASLDVNSPIDNAAVLGAGTEYQIPVADTWTLALRGGANTRTMGDVSGLSGVSLGFGLMAKPLGFDYGLVPFGDPGLTHRVSLSVKF